MDILAPIKKLMGRVKKVKDDMDKKQADQQRLMEWKEKLNNAMSDHDSFRSNAARWDELYNGTKTIAPLGSGYISNKTDQAGTDNARTVINLVFQLIESSIELDIPQPRVDALEMDDTEERKQMIEGMLTYMSDGPELMKIVSENERIAKKNSLSIMKVIYNPDYDGHTFRGRIETVNPHPVNIIPQPGVQRLQDMDYFFHIETRTLDYVCRRYGENFRTLLEEETADFEYLEEFSEMTGSSGTQKGSVSVVECWYKDKDGDVSLLTFANDVILKDMPKFYYKRDEQGNLVEFEDLQIENVDPMTGMPIVENIRVKCYIPKRYPFAVRYNIPREKSFKGKSDAEIIADQQESIKKLISIQEEKQIKGTTKIVTRKGSGLKDKLTNAISQVLETEDPTADIKVVDLKTPDTQLLELYQLYVQSAKDVLGITEASQGRSEGTNLSGRALELLANNTQNRLTVKQFEKNISFMELYRVYYDFLLAFYDDKVPYRVQGPENKPEFGYFDKAKLVKQDAAGDFYYPPFDIYIDVDQGLPKDKQFIMETAAQALQLQAIDPVEYWMIMESIGYPNASAILDMERQKQQQMMMAQQQQMAMEQAMQQQQMQAQGQQMGIQQQQAQMQAQDHKTQQVQNDPEAVLRNQVDSLPPEIMELLMQLPEEEQQQVLQNILANYDK